VINTVRQVGILTILCGCETESADARSLCLPRDEFASGCSRKSATFLCVLGSPGGGRSTGGADLSHVTSARHMCRACLRIVTARSICAAIAGALVESRLARSLASDAAAGTPRERRMRTLSAVRTAERRGPSSEPRRRRRMCRYPTRHAAPGRCVPVDASSWPRATTAAAARDASMNRSVLSIGLPARTPAAPIRRGSPPGDSGAQRLLNWKRARAAFWPYFLRSFLRGSRVT
jgi:hypothetical protein